MNFRTLALLAGSILAPSVVARAAAAQPAEPYVRVAHIEVDPARLEAYRAAAKEQIDLAVRLEPGVLALYSVYEKDEPTRVIVFEMYQDPAAYRAHLETAHFKKYKAATEGMVKSLRLADVLPITLAAKSK